jgi:peptide/histidine transporter 3/4
MASDHENHTKKGGWITTIPFLAGSVVGLGMAMSATSSNLIVYLVHKYNVKAIHAAQISNVVRGCMQLAPVLAAALSDAFFGPYPIAVAGLVFSLLSFVLFTLTAALPSLLPPPCQRGAGGGGATATSCEPPNAAQSAVLYAALCLLAAGNGGTRYNMAALGADQFAGEGQPRRRRQGGGFFSCYFAFLYASYATGDTVLVYVQDGVSWALGFGVCVATTGLALAALLLGSRHYRRPVPKGSPFTAMARVAVAAARKATVDLGSRVQYYHGCNRDDAVPRADQAPSDRFRYANNQIQIVQKRMYMNEF